MPGILRHDHDSNVKEGEEEFDRKQVLKNTERNAQLGIEGQRIREQLLGHKTKSDENSKGSDKDTKRKYPKTKAPGAAGGSHDGFPADVAFDEEEIKDWDEQRGKSQKILEPNTPYMGTAADTEYYDDDPVPNDLDLGNAA